MKFFDNIKYWWSSLALVFANEWRVVLRDPGVMLFFIALPLLYPIVYTLVYNTEVVRELPVAVVDHSRTAESRQLIQTASAAPAIKIFSYDANLEDAKQRLADGQVYAIIEIPADYAKSLAEGRQATVPAYFDMSLLLRYRALLSALTDLQVKVAGDHAATTLQTMGAESLAPRVEPVANKPNFLGDTTEGFASFVIPGIVILILQQSMVLGIMMIEGTSRERRRRNGGIDPKMVQGASLSAEVLGKSLCYVIAYLPMCIYCMHIVPEMFSLPHIGSPKDYLPFILPMLFASAFFGQTLTFMSKERESAFMIVVFTSVVFLFLSGLTWPRYAMSPLWYWVGNLIPGTWGVEGFIRINSNGATLAESMRPYLACWILSAVYFVTALCSMAHIRRTARRQAAAAAC